MNFESLNSISCNEIIPNLIIGNAMTAKNGDQYNFNLIINCTNNINYVSQSTIIRIPIDDLPEDSSLLLSHLPNVTEKIHEAILKSKKVLVHCSMGVSRSCTVVAAYLIRYYNVTSVDEVVAFIKERRKEAFFGEMRFRSVLEDWLKMKTERCLYESAYDYDDSD